MTKYKWKSSGNTLLSLPTPACEDCAHIRMLSGNIQCQNYHSGALKWAINITGLCLYNDTNEPLQPTSIWQDRTHLSAVTKTMCTSCKEPPAKLISQKVFNRITQRLILVNHISPDPCSTVVTCLSQMKVIKNNQKYKIKCPGDVQWVAFINTCAHARLGQQ